MGRVKQPFTSHQKSLTTVVVLTILPPKGLVLMVLITLLPNASVLTILTPAT